MARPERGRTRCRASGVGGRVGHVHGDPGPFDGVMPAGSARQGGGPRPALGAGARGVPPEPRRDGRARIPEDLRGGRDAIPARPQIRARCESATCAPGPDGRFPLERVSPSAALRHDPSLAARFRGKVVFVGVTAQSAARDRLITPYGCRRECPAWRSTPTPSRRWPGAGSCCRRATSVVLICVALVAAGRERIRLPHRLVGLRARGPAAGGGARAALRAFTHDIVFPYVARFRRPGFAVVGAGAFQFVVRRQLRRPKAERRRATSRPCTSSPTRCARRSPPSRDRAS